METNTVFTVQAEKNDLICWSVSLMKPDHLKPTSSKSAFGSFSYILCFKFSNLLNQNTKREKQTN